MRVPVANPLQHSSRMIAGPAVSKSSVAKDFKRPYKGLYEDISNSAPVLYCERLPIIRPLQVITTKSLRINAVKGGIVLEEESQPLGWRNLGGAPSHLVSGNVRET